MITLTLNDGPPGRLTPVLLTAPNLGGVIYTRDADGRWQWIGAPGSTPHDVQPSSSRDLLDAWLAAELRALRHETREGLCEGYATHVDGIVSGLRAELAALRAEFARIVNTPEAVEADK